MTDRTPHPRRSPMEHEHNTPDPAAEPVQYTERESPPRSLQHTHYDYPTGHVTITAEPAKGDKK